VAGQVSQLFIGTQQLEQGEAHVAQRGGIGRHSGFPFADSAIFCSGARNFAAGLAHYIQSDGSVNIISFAAFGIPLRNG
jgi:hypothetical protein